MANKRVFNNSVILTDDFLRLPHSAITLYFLLNVTADNEGFNAAPEDVMKRTRTSTDDMQLLLQKKFVLLAGNGVIVIRHWFIHNYLRSDRYKSQINHLPEKKEVGVDGEGLYMAIEGTDNDQLSLWDMIQMNEGKPLSAEDKGAIKNIGAVA